MNKKIIGVAAIILILSACVFLYFFLFRLGDGYVIVRGGAEAVATTFVASFDGLTETGHIFDELYYPIGIALLGSYIVVADTMCDRVQILSSYGNRLIGSPGQFGISYQYSGAFVDGFRENAMFTKPAGVSVTPSGDILVSDSGNHAIRLINEEFVTTIAGNGFAGYRDGAEGQAMFNNPRAAIMCQNGYIYVADTMNHVIRKINPLGAVSLFAGNPGESGFIDGELTQSRFFEPSGLYLTSGGVLYVADAANHSIRRIENGFVSTVAGRPGEQIRFSHYFEGGFADGANSDARFNFPRDIALLADGSILVADSLNHSIRLIAAHETRTIVGGGMAGDFYASAENLRLARPEGLTTDGETLFVSDSMNNRIVTFPLNERILTGRPSREQMLNATGLTANSRFAFLGDIRVFAGESRIDMNRVQPWIRRDTIFVPIRPFLTALGAELDLNEQTGVLSVFIQDTTTNLNRGSDYFIMRGVMVTSLNELMRLFPYTIEWFPDLSLISVYVPADLRV